MIRPTMHGLAPLLILCVCLGAAQTPATSPFAPAHEKSEAKVQHISFPTEDGALIYADVYGTGDRGVVLAHGGRFRKESWKPQAEQLARAGFHVLAFDFRGFGQSHGPGDKDMFTAPMYLDVLAAVRYLRENGAKTVAVMGGSFGGAAAADASSASQPGEINRLILLAAEGNGPAEKIKSPLLEIVARDDASEDGPRLPRIRAWFDKAPQPKELIVLEGSAHAQFLFQTEQADRVMKEVLRFLSATPKVHD
jgi:pimeloyl-ACP methyl ester carboxylesterase